MVGEFTRIGGVHHGPSYKVSCKVSGSKQGGCPAGCLP